MQAFVVFLNYPNPVVYILLDECVAVNGQPCIFPFNYHGKTFDKCTHYDANFGKVWCAVAVNSGDDMTSWKDCDTEACKGEIILTLTVQIKRFLQR